MGTGVRGRAVVLGASMTGMLAARVLAERPKPLLGPVSAPAL